MAFFIFCFTSFVPFFFRCNTNCFCTLFWIVFTLEKYLYLQETTHRRLELQALKQVTFWKTLQTCQLPMWPKVSQTCRTTSCLNCVHAQAHCIALILRQKKRASDFKKSLRDLIIRVIVCRRTYHGYVPFSVAVFKVAGTKAASGLFVTFLEQNCNKEHVLTQLLLEKKRA